MSPLHFLRYPGLATLIALQNFAFGAEISERRIGDLFRPFVAADMSLSTDGRYLAYTQHTGNALNIVVMDLDDPMQRVTIAADEDLALATSKERQRAELRLLRWASPRRLVFAPAVRIIPPAVTSAPPGVLDPDARDTFRTRPLEPTTLAPILSVDADGRHPKTLADASDFVTHIGAGGGFVNARTVAPEILGFAPGDRESLLIRVKGFTGSDPVPTRVYRVNTVTGKMTTIKMDSTVAKTLYDRQGYPRLFLEGGERRAPEIRYRYSEAGSTRRPLLAELTKGTLAVNFNATPADHYGERTLPLGFGFEPNLLLYASNVGRDTYGVYVLDMATMKPGAFKLEHPTRDLISATHSNPGEGLLFDDNRQQFVGLRTLDHPEMTVWLDRGIGEIQQALDTQFPGRTVTITEWNDARTRFLIRITGGTEPGRVYVLKTHEKSLVEISRSAPWLNSETLNETRYVEFPGTANTTLSGYLTVPKKPRLQPAPLVIMFAPGLPAKPHAEFNRESHVLADMGFAVLRLNQRGVTGRGLRQRDMIRTGMDKTATEDAAAAIDWVASRMAIDRKRVVAMGEGMGGYLAVRATQLAPDMFRCAVGTEPVLDLAAATRPSADLDSGPPSFQQEADRLYLNGADGKMNHVAATADPEQANRPVFIIYRAGRGNHISTGISRLRSQYRQRGVPLVAHETGEDYFMGLPRARTMVYRALDEFLNINLFNYDVQIGPTKVVR